MAIRTKSVKAGSWQTLESFWNATATAFFLQPSGAKVRVRYGGNSWWNGFTREEKSLNGLSVIKVSIGKASILYSRLQIRVDRDQNITYDIYPGSVAVQSPEFSF